MMTNTYRPHVGGVARSVESFTGEFRRQGHNVLVVAPRFEHIKHTEPGVVRVPAIQNFNGSDFSVRVAIPGLLLGALTKFKPDVVHSHQPFLMGDAALRVAVSRNLPLIFTHHTMYEFYTHYVPGDSDAMKRFVISLATGYANLCDYVIAPSQSVARVLHLRGVETPVATIPTGIPTDLFEDADGSTLRRRLNISDDTFVVGHVGRLAPEKNLVFLAEAVAQFVGKQTNRCFVVAGDGPLRRRIEATFDAHDLADRLFALGRLEGKDLIDAYAGFDVFAFSSTTETQGLVLLEAMAAGVPVVALDAPGVCEVLDDEKNGHTVYSENVGDFADAMEWIHSRSPQERKSLSITARQTASRFSLNKSAQQTLALYRTVKHIKDAKVTGDSLWEQAMRRLSAEWKVWSARAKAGTKALISTTAAAPSNKQRKKHAHPNPRNR